MSRKSSWTVGGRVAGVMIAVLAIVITSMVVLAGGHVELVIDYDPPFLPEGIAVDKSGTLYVGMVNQSEIRMITQDGAESVLATLPTGGFGLLGLAVDSPGNVYAALATADGVTNGVYRVSPDGASEQLPGSEAILTPNSLAFDKRGNLYVTDTLLGSVWRIPRDGAAELWLQDVLLEGTGNFGFGFPIGANGIAYLKGEVYVANTEKGHIVRIPVNKDGSPGTPEILLADPDLIGVDGLTLDVHGNLYAVNFVMDRLLRINVDDPGLTVLASEGFDAPASLAFGTGKGDRQSVYISNFALLSEANPGVVKVDVGVPGWPVP